MQTKRVPTIKAAFSSDEVLAALKAAYPDLAVQALPSNIKGGSHLLEARLVGVCGLAIEYSVETG